MKDKEERLYKESYQQFCKQVVDKKIITDKEVMLMTKLFDYFVKCVQGAEGLDAYIKLSKISFENKLTYPQLVLHKPSKRNMSELVFCEDLSAGVIAAGHISMRDSSDTETSSQEEREIPGTSTQKKTGNNEQEEMRTLFHAAMILRGKIEECDNFTKSGPCTI